MKIAIIVEGKTEKAFIPILRRFINSRAQHNKPTLRPIPQHGRIPKEDKLRRLVENLLDKHDAVIALTDVYTNNNGMILRDFEDAADAKAKMRAWVGNNPKFYPHAAQYDFEAWLLPYWSHIQEITGHNKTAPPGNPEQVNHNKPPSKHIWRFLSYAKKNRDSYNKEVDAARILKGQDLLTSVNACPELKAFINTILQLAGEKLIS